MSQIQKKFWLSTAMFVVTGQPGPPKAKSNKLKENGLPAPDKEIDMTFQAHNFRRPRQAPDSTWVLPLSPDTFNGYAASVPVPFGMNDVFAVGSLMRVESEEAGEAQEVLWRVVAQTPSVNGSLLAVLVPTDVPSNVPAASVARVENAVKGRPGSSMLCQPETRVA